MKVVAIIQARMGSTRLPGKVMRDLCGMPVLAHVIARARAVPGVNEVVVATTEDPDDTIIEQAARLHSATAFRGSETDVLDRYYRAASHVGADIVIRITSDCPLFDPVLVGVMIDRFRVELGAQVPADYLSNTMTRSYPRGFDAEVFTFASLARAWREAAAPSEREHVTPYLYRHPEIFRLVGYVGARDLSHYRLTLDTDDDWRLLHAVCFALGCGSRIVRAEELIGFLDKHPEIAQLNAHVQQKATEV